MAFLITKFDWPPALDEHDTTISTQPFVWNSFVQWVPFCIYCQTHIYIHYVYFLDFVVLSYICFNERNLYTVFLYITHILISLLRNFIDCWSNIYIYTLFNPLSVPVFILITTFWSKRIFRVDVYLFSNFSTHQ